MMIVEFEPMGNESDKFVVLVYDENNNMICYCGPYDQWQRDTCLGLFVGAGWTRGGLRKRYERHKPFDVVGVRHGA